jgi:hypothetical protein
LNITQRLLLVFEIENKYAMEREYGYRLSYIFREAVTGAATGREIGEVLGPAGSLIGLVSGAAIGALRGLFKR